jgi:hypothetical protein
MFSRWRIIVIYLGFGPLIGAALIAVISIPVAAASSPTPMGSIGQVGFGIAFILGLILVAGFIFGAVPALLAGIAASFLHRPSEPKWKSALVGLVTGAVGSAIVALAYSELRGAEGFPWPVFWIGAFAGMSCGLLQRRLSPQRIQ